jgi:hypothetical protein
MKKSHLIIQVVAGVFSAIPLLVGCVAHNTVKDEPRRTVQFGSAHAAQAFYDAYLKFSHPTPKNSNSIYISLPYWHNTIVSENVRLNKALESADSDQNGTISEAEAEAYQSKNAR